MGKMLENRDGTILIVAVIVTMILAGLSASFLVISRSQANATIVSETDMQVLYVAESGVSVSVAEIQGGIDYETGLKDGDVGFDPGDTTGKIGDGDYVTTADNFDVLNDRWLITSVGTIGNHSRSIEVVIGPDPTSPFQMSMFGDVDVGLAGNVFCDSYDSDIGTYASQAVNIDDDPPAGTGRVTPSGTGRTYARLKGGVGSNMDITLRGTVVVFGDVIPGPTGTVSKQGTVDIAGTDSVPRAEEEVIPVPVYVPQGGPNFSTLVDITLDDTGGDIHYSDFNAGSQAVVTITGDVVLYCDGDFTVGAQAEINIPAGSTLTVHHGSGKVSFGAGSLSNSGAPADFRLYSSTADTIKFGGGAGFHGAVYAPAAAVEPAGGSEIFGAIIANSIKINGGATFHYDEALGRIQFGDLVYETISWREL